MQPTLASVQAPPGEATPYDDGLPALVRKDRPHITGASSRGHCNTWANLCDGVIPSRVCRCLTLSEWAASSRSVWVRRLMSVPLGKY